MINTVIEKIRNNELNDVISALYLDDKVIEIQKARYIDLLRKFNEIFKDGEVSIYNAPGRSEVGGNHTDHQHGRVLAASITLDMIAAVRKRNDNIIHVHSDGYEIKPVDISDLNIHDTEAGTSESLIRGVCAGLKNAGFAIGGLDICMQSEVLGGSGLSSSAAFEVLIGTIISGEYNDGKASAVEIAKIGQFSENKYFMKPCGLMDQMACSVGGLITIDFNDPSNPIIEKVEFDFKQANHSLCIVDTKGSHADLTHEYASIPNDMLKVSKYFNKTHLRDVDTCEFSKNIADIREKCGDRAVLRSHHFFDENSRVVEQVNSLKNNNFDLFKKLIKASGDSSYKCLQNIFATSNVDEQNISVGLAISDSLLNGKGVSRVHGGGFAGTIQAFVPDEILDEYKEGMEKVFGEGCCYVLKIRPLGGYKVI